MATTFNYQEYLASRSWALLKNQVRERSGGICERCRQAPMQSTHHKTYERIGHESLDDLLGVCNPCHEFLSGKSNYDPAAQGQVPTNTYKPVVSSRKPRVYLAGKIGLRDWRHTIFPELRGLVSSSDLDVSDTGHGTYAVQRRGPAVPSDIEMEGIIYGGPYFVGCDHGGFHGEGSHGQGAADEIPCQCTPEGVWRSEVISECLYLIDRADAVLCWLDAPDAYGSIFELGYAHRLGIPTFIAYPSSTWSTRWIRDMWFAKESAESHWASPTPLEAWKVFVQNCVPYLRLK